jgi:hypothetical protein
MHYAKHKLVKSTLPSHHVRHHDTRVPPNCRRAGKQAASRHPEWLDISLKRVLLPVAVVAFNPQFPRNHLNSTRRSERHAWALLKRPYQAAYYSVFHITIYLGDLLEGFGGVGAVFNARGLVCGCVNRVRKFTPHTRVVFLESKREKTQLTYVWINIARCKHARAIGFGEGRGLTWALGTHHVDGGV